MVTEMLCACGTDCLDAEMRAGLPPHLYARWLRCDSVGFDARLKRETERLRNAKATIDRFKDRRPGTLTPNEQREARRAVGTLHRSSRLLQSQIAELRGTIAELEQIRGEVILNEAAPQIARQGQTRAALDLFLNTLQHVVDKESR